MNETEQRALLCGFGDVAAGIGGLAWDLGESGALLLDKGEVRPATFAIEEGGDAFALAITADDGSVEVTLRPQMAVIRDSDGTNPVGFRAMACVAEVRSKAGTQTLECSGQISRWTGSPLEGVGTFRHLAIEGADGSQLIATSQGEPGSSGHGEEDTSGWLLGSEDGASFEETLISTQYNGGGAPTRIGLELWPEDADHASRAGAVRVAGCVLGGIDAGGTWAGLFRCHTDGTEGLGSYLLWRA
jgi:hypothetical protein